MRALVAVGVGQAILPRVCIPADGPAVRVPALIDDVPSTALVRRARPTARPVAAFLEALWGT